MKKFYLLIFFNLIFSNFIFGQIIFNSKKELIDFAISNSKSLQQAKIFSLEKLKNTKLAIKDFLPTIQLSWTDFENVNFNSADTQSKSIEVTLSQPIFNNGKSLLNYKFNKYSAMLSYLNYEKELKNFTLNLSQKYYEYFLQCEIIKLKNELLENMMQNLKIIEYEFNNGIALKSDYLEYKISCKEIENQIKKEEDAKKNIYLELQNLIGLKQSENFSINFSETNYNFKTEKLLERLSDFENSILENDISLKEKSANLNFQKSQNKILNNFYLPSIILQGGVSFSGKTYPLTQPNYSIKLVFSFDSLPFFPSSFSPSASYKNQSSVSKNFSTSTNIIPDLQYFSNKRLTKISLNQAFTEKENYIESLKKNILQYVQQNDSQLDYILLLEESIKLKEEKFTILEFQKNEGLLSTSDYLKEKINLSEAKQSLAKEKINLLILQNQISILIGEKIL